MLVLGGRGFIGRYVVRSLLQRGHRVVVGSRYAAPASPQRPEQRRCRFQELVSPEQWLPLLESVDAVVNCVGILRERWGERYQAVHCQAPAALASACAAQGIRLLHVSALGLRADAGSGFIRSKLAGEQALLATAADLVIVRPSLLDGRDGFGARWLRMLARFPIYLLPASSAGRLACMCVEELGEALARLALLSPAEVARLAPQRMVELGGPEDFVLADYLHRLRGAPSASLVIPIPHWLCRLFSHLCDLLHLTPYSFGHLELLARDNRPAENQLPAILGRAPRAISAWNQPARQSEAPQAVIPDPAGSTENS